MRISRLRLAGFKSFVDPTDLPIMDGLTGIVGPNGCGKSNLLEALRWVMGETRPTAMRGDGMEDVIFAGTASRPARSFAEVSLSIDNTERKAPQGFNDSDVLDVVRRITRDAGSAYKANGRDVRARDIQILFADASTGSHSPALVRQGQIAELINAKPTARRRILEEAAGISGLYQRRHEAELKLKGAEANLTRVEDVIEQLAQQIASLVRQARSAARYREIGAALREAEGLLLWRRWREAEDAREAADRALASALTAVGGAERQARAASERHGKAVEALPAAREEAAIAGAILQRLTVERETLDSKAAQATAAIEQLESRLGQMEHDIRREEALTHDAAATLGRLADEAAELSAASTGDAGRLAEAQAEATDAAKALTDRETALAELTETMAVLVARHRSAERALQDAQAETSREAGEVERLTRIESEASDALAKADTAVANAESAREATRTAAARAEAALAVLDEDRARAQQRDSEAAARKSEVEQEERSLKAEAETLRRLLEADRNDADRLLDHVGIVPGYETALAAALGNDLSAPLADDGDHGWAELAGDLPAPTLSAEAQSLATVVTAPELLSRRLQRVGIVAAEDGTRLQASLGPGERLVSTEGHLWRWDGLTRKAGEEGAEAAMRLAQANRRAAILESLEQVCAASAEARAERDRAAAELAEVTEREATGRAARLRADDEAAGAERALSRAVADRETARQRLDGVRGASARHRRAAQAAKQRSEQAREALKRVGDPDAARSELETAREVVEAARLAMLTRRSTLDEIKREGAAREARLASIGEEHARWESRRSTAERRLTDLRSRCDRLAQELESAKAVPAEVEAARHKLRGSLDEAEERQKLAEDALAEAEAVEREAANAARDAERDAGAAREVRAAASAKVEAAAETARLASERIVEELETQPVELGNQLADAALSDRSMPDIEGEVARLRRAREMLGAVNLRAEEDAAEVRAEHEALTAEKTDLEEAIATLRRGISGLNREGRERLLNAFAEVNDNFGTLFTHLFGGGEARLEMVESDDPLEAGLEILCQPPGKKLSTLSLLSGGEQTLTALALIFAVFLANPAPICVLDEVDAPLDDANVTRFCDLLDEMSRRTNTRFVIITHHALTMARMDRLFGVTMAEHGVSQLVSVDLRAAEQLAA